MRIIYAVHQWVSLICALFLLLLVLTGLPLLFRGEIHAWNTLNLPERGGPMAMTEIWQALPEATEAVKAASPAKEILSVTPDPSDGTLSFLVKDPEAQPPRTQMRMGGERIIYDVRAGTAFNRADRVYRSEAVREFMHTMHILHVRMGMDHGGRDLLATMCVLAVISVVSGVYLYLPMMKKLSFGTLRRKTSRLFWSDWHKLVSIFAGVWTVAMCLSGIFIVLYSAGARDYHREAQAAAAEHFAVQMQAADAIPPAEALAQIQTAYPKKDIVSMRLPAAEGLYAFQIAEPTPRATDFALGEDVYLPAGGGEPFFVPAAPWLTMAAFFLNIHIHNHEMLGTKLVWTFLILTTAAMIITGIALWLTRWRSRISAAADAAVKARTNSSWEEPARVTGLTLILLIAPLYGELGEKIALAFGAYMVFYFVRALRG